MDKNPEISIILPCRNEEAGLAFCLEQITQTIQKNSLSAEIIVSDSSIDKSPQITLYYAQKNSEIKISLVKHDKEGYGMAYLEGFKVARGKYIFMADADGTYDFSQIPNFINPLRQNYDFVIGNRFSGKIEKESMPFMNRYIGNPILSGILRIFFNTKIKDSHCGIRAIKKEFLASLNLQTTGMEFASEMVIKAIKNKLKIKEISTNYFKRKGTSKLKPFSDAWKHTRFMLLYSPLFLFFLPGAFLFTAGFFSMAWLYSRDPEIFGIHLFYHPLFLSSLMVISGYQLIIFSMFAKTYAIIHLKEDSSLMKKLFQIITIEKASIFGMLITLAGILIYFFIFKKWVSTNFGELEEIKNSIIALTLITVGMQTIFSSFMLSILGIKK